METKEFQINGVKYIFLRYKDEWVFPVFDIYENGLGSPLAMTLYSIEDGIVDCYACITVNLPECKRSAGCQFINMNNNDAGILDWLEEYGFGKRTGKRDSPVSVHTQSSISTKVKNSGNIETCRKK